MAFDFLARMTDGSLFSMSVWSFELSLLTVKSIFILCAAALFTSTALYDRFKFPNLYPMSMVVVGVVLWLVSVCYLAGSDFNPFIYFRF